MIMLDGWDKMTLSLIRRRLSVVNVTCRTMSSSNFEALPLPAALCPCANVRRSCLMVMEETPYVKINNVKIEEHVSTILALGAASTEWDADGWHYTAVGYHGDERKERIVLYILALDAINFCFWPHPTSSETNSLEYEHLAIALTKLAESGNDGEFFFSPSRLSTLTAERMEASLTPHLQGHHLPNLSERCRLWNELGHALLASPFDGSVLTLLNMSELDGPRLVHLLIRHVPGFRDEAVWRGRWVALYKRAQIAVGDLNAALDLQLTNMDQLTTFADYRVPQVLRNAGVLEYSEALQIKVDSLEELENEEELSIRAGTVVAVDELVARVNRAENNNMTAVKLDWHLWQVGEKLNVEGKLKPHHRVNTIFY
jgi:hypothetical protein